MKKTKGFTLIELLAVIVILAIIALIATPLTISVINSAKEKSFVNSAYGLLDGVRLLSTEQLINDGPSEVVVQFQDGETDNQNFKVSGDMPASGTIHLNKDGKIELKVWSEELGKCAEKGTDESEVKLTETTKEECKIEVKENTTTGQTFTEVMEPLLGTEVMNNDQDGNLRYVGPSPNNYVSFNGELWRIIGVFHDDEKGDQIKIIRSEQYSKVFWDDDSDGSYSNNWAVSSLQLSLNNTTDGYIKTIEKNDPTSYSYIDVDHVWNIGGFYTNYTTVGTRNDYYIAERSENLSSAMTSHLWTGAIGLMYPSDYGYASSGDPSICDSVVMINWGSGTNIEYYETCAKNSWLYDSSDRQWTITASSGNNGGVYMVDYNGYVTVISIMGYYKVRPVLFLKSDVKIIGGQGTDQQPFILSQ